jgi:hypothetical protein
MRCMCVFRRVPVIHHRVKVFRYGISRAWRSTTQIIHVFLVKTLQPPVARVSSSSQSVSSHPSHSSFVSETCGGFPPVTKLTR